MNDALTTPTPEPGMGAFQRVGSDRYAYTITRVSTNGKTVWARPCKALRIDNNGAFSDTQHHVFAETDEPEECFTLRRNGRFIQKGRKQHESWCALNIGKRRAYHDPCF